jgi:hypothetical protein
MSANTTTATAITGLGILTLYNSTEQLLRISAARR